MFEKYLTKTGRVSTKQPQDVKNVLYTRKFQEVHGDRYDYTNIEYSRAVDKVEIICKEHGSFFQTPNDHLKGKGCPRCCGNNKKSTEECIQDFISVHGDTYKYSKVEYINTATKVEIICKEHGSFFQSPNHHLKGNGCPKCQNQNQDTLYILKCLNTGLIKIGITNSLKQRISGIGGNLEYIHHINTEDPRTLERYLHEKYQKHNVFNPTVRSGGTEFFNLSDSQVQEIEEIINNVGTITT